MMSNGYIDFHSDNWAKTDRDSNPINNSGYIPNENFEIKFDFKTSE